MPKVKTDTVYFDDKQYRRNFKVNASGEFSVNFPKVAGELLGCGTVLTGNTLSEVYNLWRAKAAEYKQTQTQTSKVVVFSFETSASIWSEEEQRVVFTSNEISFSEGTAVSVWWCPCIEQVVISTDGSKHYRYINDEGNLVRLCGKADPSHGERVEDGHRIEWSEEREAFFERINAGMETLILALASLHEDKAKLLACADGKLSLPLPTTGARP